MNFENAGLENQTVQFALLVRESPVGISELLHFFNWINQPDAAIPQVYY
jgi:hypothetical protein